MSAMNLAATMTLNGSQFTGALSGIRGAMGGMLGRLAVMTGGVASLAGVMAGMRGAIDFAGQLTDLSARTGESVGQLAILRQAFDDTGVGADKAAELLNFMQRNLNEVDKYGNTANKGLKTLHVSLKDLVGMSGVDQLNAIGQKIMNIEDPAKRTAVAMEVFGRSGAQALQYFSDTGAFDSAKQSLGSLPGLLDKNAASFDQIGDYMGRLKGKWTGLFTGIMTGVAPQLEAVMEKVDAVDFAGWGVKIANAGKLAHAVFANGNLGKVAGLSLEYGFKQALNFLFGPLMSLATWKGLGQIILAGLVGLGTGLLKLFTAPIVYLRAGLDKAIDEMFEQLGKIPKLGKWMGIDQHEAKTFQEHLAASRTRYSFLSDAGDRDGEAAKALLAGGLRDLKTGMADGADPLNATAVRGQLAEVMQEARASLAEAAPAMAEAVAAATSATAEGLAQVETKGGKAEKPLTDQLTRIGGYMGGESPQVREQKEGNRILKKIELGIKSLVIAQGGAPVAVWAE